jgi:integrase/recombinase XerD
MSVRALGKWSEDAGISYFQWWKQVPLVTEQVLPQATVTEDVYRQVLTRCKTPRDKALIEVLWSSGLRRSEIERMKIEHLDFVNGFIVVPTSKANRPRVVPMSPQAMRALRRLIRSRTEGSVFAMTGNAIRLRLARMGAPSAHAWRRGWAVHALRRGVSETSVKAAAGWRSGAMVSRYTNALSGELAMAEFRVSWHVHHL